MVWVRSLAWEFLRATSVPKKRKRKRKKKEKMFPRSAFGQNQETNIVLLKNKGPGKYGSNTWIPSDQQMEGPQLRKMDLPFRMNCLLKI